MLKKSLKLDLDRKINTEKCCRIFFLHVKIPKFVINNLDFPQ